MADWRARAMVLVAVVAGTATACGSRTGDYLAPGLGDEPGEGGVSGVGAGGGVGFTSDTGPAQASVVGSITNGVGPGTSMGLTFGSAFGPSSSIGNTSGTFGMGNTFGSGGAFAVSVVTGSSNSSGGVAGAGGATQNVSVAVTGMGGAAATTTGEGGVGGVAECVLQSQSKCESCLCVDCFEAYGDCIGDFGCPLIFECIEATGCNGLDCYTPDTCQAVVDRFGGLMGASVGYVTELIACAVAAPCPCE